jgi:EmrB/QacA subfamily drug resistance transporter
MDRISTVNPSPTVISEADPSAHIKRLLPWLVAVAFFMESLDATILNTAVPAIAAALEVSPLSMKAVLSSYTLALAMFVPVSGWLADRFGTRRVFSTAIALFTLGSLLCGLSTNIHMLVASRIVQGMGGAMMLPVGRLTMVRTFAKSELVLAMSFVAIPGLVGPMVGPVAGGVIVHYLHWRAIFFVNLPIGLIGLYLVVQHLPNYFGDHQDPLDWTGLALFSTGVALLSYVLEVFGEHTLSSREILSLLAIALVLLAAYGRHSLSLARPLLRFVLFKIRTFRIAVVGSFVTRLGAGGMPFLLPLLYQVGMGLSPIQSALFIVPQPLAAMSTKPVVRRLLKRWGYRRVLLFNTIAMGAMMASFATVGPDTPVWRIVLQAFVFGFCSSTQYSSMNTLVYADVEGGDTSMASTMSSTFQQMSMSFGVAAASIAAALFVPTQTAASASEMVRGVHMAFLALGTLTMLSALVFRGLQPDDGLSVSGNTAS